MKLRYTKIGTLMRFLAFFVGSIFLIGLVLLNVSSAAVTVDATSTFGGTVPTATYAYNMTIGSNANFLLVAVDTAGNNVSSVKVGTSTLTVIHSAGSDRCAFAYMVNPPTGLQRVTSTISTSDNGYSSAISFAGVSSTNPIGASGTTFNSPRVTDATTTITTMFANSLNVDCMSENNGTLDTMITSGVNQTKRSQAKNSVSSESISFSTQTTTNVGSYSMAWTGMSTVGQSTQLVLELVAGPVATPVVAAPRRNPIITFVE